MDMEEKLPYLIMSLITYESYVDIMHILDKVNNTIDLYRYTKYERNNFNNTIKSLLLCNQLILQYSTNNDTTIN
jgi:hypothetical protein